MKRLGLLIVVLPFTLAPGCPTREFGVVMERTSDGKVQRELRVWTEDDGVKPPQEDMLAAARRAYGYGGSEVEKKHVYRETFGPGLPSDLVHGPATNRGFFVSSTSDVGSVLTYSERMPGSTHPVDLVRAAEKMSDTLTRALAAYVRQHPELACDSEGLACVTEFLETEARDDVLNVLLLAWLGVARGQAARDATGELTPEAERTIQYAEALRIADYLLEREVLRVEELSPLWEEVMPRLVRGAVRKVAVLAGHAPSPPWPATLERLADTETCEAEFEQVLDEGLEAIGSSKEALQAQLDPALPSYLGTSTQGRVVWRCKSPPSMTNGQWDEAAAELSWEANGRSGFEPPRLLFAVWAEPNEEFQRAHFGVIALCGIRLLNYLEWRTGLAAPERGAWDAFVDGCEPGPSLVKKLKEFRLPALSTIPSTAPTEPEPAAVRGAALILEGL